MDNRSVNVTSKNNCESSVNEKDIEIIKNIFIKPVVDMVRIAKVNNKEVEPILKAVIPEEFIEELKNGNLKLMESKTEEILPNIVDSKHKIVKKIRLEEIKEKLDDRNIDRLGEYAIGQKLDAIKDQLECVMLIAEDIEKGQRNDRYSKVDGAIRDIKQSLLEDDVNKKDRMQDNAQSKLNEAIEVLSKEVNDGISFFKEWEERNFIQRNFGSVKFSTWNISRKFNKLCEDYLYFNRAKTSLIELKLAQGMNKYKIDLMIEDLDVVEVKLKESNISNWLPPKTKKNEWQYKLLSAPKYKKEVIVEYNIKELCDGGYIIYGN